MMWIKEQIRRLRGKRFLLDTLTLSAGTLAGRLLSLAALPILTRLYSPADFSLLATYMAVLSIVSVISCLRLEVAIPMAQDDEDAANLFAACFALLSVVTILTFIVVLLVPDTIASLLNRPLVAQYLWLIPIGLWLSGSYSAFQYWYTRKKRFGHISRTRITQSLAGSATMLLLGFLGIAPFGLLVGNTLSTGAGSIGLAIYCMYRDHHLFNTISIAKMVSCLRRHYKFPLFSAPEALLSAATTQFPILIISAYTLKEAGYLFVSLQLLLIPTMLIGTSVSQVFMSRSYDAHVNGALDTLVLTLLFKLLLFGLGPVVLLSGLIFVLAPIFLGMDWGRVGEMSVVLAPWAFLVLLTNPISSVLPLAGRNEIGLIVQLFGFILRSSMVYLTIVLCPTYATAAFAAAGVLSTVVTLIVYLKFSGVTLGSASIMWNTLSHISKGYVVVAISFLVFNFATGVLSMVPT